MANADDEQQQVPSGGNESDIDNSDVSSEDGDSGNGDQSPEVEWLATGREKRSTAGNRMKSMIAAEEPDDDLELLFAEDEDDAGFTDIEDNGSDVQMDSSSDEEDGQENGDDLEGEKELEKKARENRQATRKRKAQEAIPIKFRKKVKIAPTPSRSSAAPEPKPRPKKKSERTSWLPSPADMPTRASKRETTMLSKEQLHQQMIEREVKRLKQVEAMEKKAKKMEALKKPPMTQAQRLAEAAIVEKKNSKSLNRWEEAEKQREEERRAKLAALNNRTLDGPVVTFWSGVGEWVDGKLKHVGKIVTIEEKPVKKKRVSAAGQDMPAESPDKEEPEKHKEPTQTTADKVSNEESDLTSNSTTNAPEKKGDSELGAAPNQTIVKDITMNSEKSTTPTNNITIPAQQTQVSAAEGPLVAPCSSAKDLIPPSLPVTSSPLQPQAQKPKPPEIKSLDARAPDVRPPSTGSYTTSMFAPPQPSQLMKPPEMRPPNSFLAPPAGITQSGLSMPRIGYHSAPSAPSIGSSSAVLAHPNTAQRQSPLSMPQAEARPPPTPTQTHPIQPLAQPTSINMPVSTPITTSAPPPTPVTAPMSTPTPTPPPIPASIPTPIQTSTPTPTQKHMSSIRHTLKTPLSTIKSTKINAQKHQPKEAPPPPPPSPPANGKATRNCIILQNFNENAIKEKAIQNKILFGKDMAKLGKPAPAPRCVITNHPARYRDPRTGLPYYNAYAFQEIQKLWHGEYKWSRLAGAWMGNGSSAATGVPARFLDPDAPGPPKKVDVPEPSKEGVSAESNKDAGPDISITSTTPVIPTMSGEQKEQIATTNVTPLTAAASSDPPSLAAPVPAPFLASTPVPATERALAIPVSTAPTHTPAPAVSAVPTTIASAAPTPVATTMPMTTVNQVTSGTQ
ncbi:hypothetical protein M426DRAFT_100529 [Hypoxylon sp. CI-4A]|nr:hypothetical protein M426DRAFT_100529 [Hypoxylon sp. CI-4A]